MSTLDGAVRAQIDAAKHYFASEGFSDVNDAPVQKASFDLHLHTILMTWNGRARILRLSYTWLQEHDPNAVRERLVDGDFADRLKQGNELKILGDGTINEPHA